MEYKWDYRKKYTKRNIDKEAPLEPSQYWKKRESDLKKCISFLNGWFKGRVISIDMQKILKSFNVLHLVRNNEIEEAKELLLNS